MVSKYLVPSNYLRKFLDGVFACYAPVYRALFFKRVVLERIQQEQFALLKLDYHAAVERLNAVLRQTGGHDYDAARDSIHWLLFSALSIARPDTARILEIGTFTGEFTLILTHLFPESQIITVDLPPNDPLMRSFYGREKDELYEQYLQTQKANLSSDRILPLKLNSFFLLDTLDEPIDLIWVDGGHHYPEIAWDLCNAWHLCKKGGAILVDDVIPLHRRHQSKLVSTDSHRVLQYIESRVDQKIILFLKRISAAWHCRPSTRKYVSYLEK